MPVEVRGQFAGVVHSSHHEVPEVVRIGKCFYLPCHVAYLHDALSSFPCDDE